MVSRNDNEFKDQNLLLIGIVIHLQTPHVRRINSPVLCWSKEIF